MNFKRILFYCLSLCLIAHVSSCSSDDDATVNEETGWITPTLESNFESLKSSRLQVDLGSGKVNWTSNDELLVFVHESGKMPTSEKEWKACSYKFVTNSEDCAKNRFVQESNASHTLLLNPTKSYDWYVMYPYNTTVTSPVGHGHFSIAHPTMDMQAPTAHLATYDVMSNVLKSQKADHKVALTLNHLTTLMLFTVHNLTDEPFVPQSMNFEATAPAATLSGDFAVDFEKGLQMKTGSNQISLDLRNATTVSPKSSFTVATMMAPFSLTAGDKFNIRVVTDKSNTLQSSTMKGNISFKAGTKSTANVKVTPAPIINQDIDGWESEDIEGWGDQGSKDNVIM